MVESWNALNCQWKTATSRHPPTDKWPQDGEIPSIGKGRRPLRGFVAELLQEDPNFCASVLWVMNKVVHLVLSDMKLVKRRPHKSAKKVPHYQSIFDSSLSEASLISSCVQKLWLAWACHASPQGSTVAWWPTFPRLLQRKLWGQALHLRRMIKELLSECIISGQTTKAAWSKRSSTALAIALSNL